MVKNILLCGVGGQGTILTSRILSKGLLSAGFDVKMAEIHGMSQRGGTVDTQIRYGDKVYSPIIEEGSADMLIAFEKSEGLRSLPYLKPGGILIVNNQEIIPITVAIGTSKYPEDPVAEYKKLVEKTFVINAAEIAEGLGNVRAFNIVLLGAVVKLLGLCGLNWREILAEEIPKKALEVNIRAFEEGLISCS